MTFFAFASGYPVTARHHQLGLHGAQPLVLAPHHRQFGNERRRAATSEVQCQRIVVSHRRYLLGWFRRFNFASRASSLWRILVVLARAFLSSSSQYWHGRSHSPIW